MAKGDVLVRLDNVVKHFPIRGGVLLRQVDSVKAVNGVSFDIREGETFGLVGESGCGKSTLGSVVLGLDAPTSGSVTFDGKDVHKARGAQRRDLHRQMQVVFQDPFESLNPRMTVEEIVGEGLRIHGGLSKEEIHDRVMEMLARVGLEPGHARRYPHEFSGGQRQRIGIARALIVEPASSSATSRSRRWTCLCRRRSSTCCVTCSGSMAIPTCSSPTASTWCAT